MWTEVESSGQRWTATVVLPFPHFPTAHSNFRLRKACQIVGSWATTLEWQAFVTWVLDPFWWVVQLAVTRGRDFYVTAKCLPEKLWESSGKIGGVQHPPCPIRARSQAPKQRPVPKSSLTLATVLVWHKRFVSPYGPRGYKSCLKGEVDVLQQRVVSRRRGEGIHDAQQNMDRSKNHVCGRRTAIRVRTLDPSQMSQIIMKGRDRSRKPPSRPNRRRRYDRGRAESLALSECEQEASIHGNARAPSPSASPPPQIPTISKVAIATRALGR
ncbi:hypothetical protein DFP72DRAFT_839581 [Ephemerocybe angulata]|uniref:Uncharacterized protein n=1 Tax=Ephemerocybe angulata TaxID=980116 RepID=A0A8H6IK25_9AGAR|nr:hypothetical protein DFP72DRAFT_839581 [Tulosesus angulatus]